MSRKNPKSEVVLNNKLQSAIRLVIPVIAVFLAVILPWPVARILAFFAVVISFTLFDSISRPAGVVLFAAFFALAYLFSPYWLYITTVKDNAVVQAVGPRVISLIAMFVLLLTGLFWAYLSAGSIPPQNSSGKSRSLILRVIPLVALALLVLVCNYAPLQNNISVLGDESYHINRIRLLRQLLLWFFIAAKNVLPLAAVIVALVTLFLWLKRFSLAVILGFICGSVLAVFLAVTAWNTPPIVGRLDMLRYPFVTCWFDYLGPVWKTNPNDERLFRVIPLISAFAIACLVWWMTRKQLLTPVAAFITALAFALVPSIHYYSTTLYLEMPVVALLFVVLYFIEPLLTADFKSVRSSPGWFALLVACFMKETMITFVAGIIFLRLLIRVIILCKTHSLNLKTILSEMAAAFCIGTPLAVYISLLFLFGQSRPYAFSLGNITNITFLTVALKAIWSQFGLLLPLALAGLVLCIFRRRFVFAFSITALFSLHFLFHFFDNPDYLAIPRFNLFLFSTLAVPAIIWLGWLAGKNRPASLVASVLLLIINLVMSPVSVKGEKLPEWSSPVNKVTAEYYFPLEDAVNWLKVNRPNVPLLITGAYGSSNIVWYFDKLGYHPPNLELTADPDKPPMETLTQTLELARSRGIPLVVWHKMQGGSELTEQEKSLLGYKAVKVFGNRYVALVIYDNRP